jgi:hypothetical protein
MMLVNIRLIHSNEFIFEATQRLLSADSRRLKFSALLYLCVRNKGLRHTP